MHLFHRAISARQCNCYTVLIMSALPGMQLFYCSIIICSAMHLCYRFMSASRLLYVCVAVQLFYVFYASHFTAWCLFCGAALFESFLQYLPLKNRKQFYIRSATKMLFVRSIMKLFCVMSALLWYRFLFHVRSIMKLFCVMSALLWYCFLFHVRSIMKLFCVMSALLWSCFRFYVSSVMKLFSISCPHCYEVVSVFCPLCYKAVFCFMSAL